MRRWPEKEPARSTRDPQTGDGLPETEVNAKFHPTGGRFLIKDYPKDGEYRRLKLTDQIVGKLQAYVRARGLRDGDLMFAMPERGPALKMLPNPDRLGRTQPNAAGCT